MAWLATFTRYGEGFYTLSVDLWVKHREKRGISGFDGNKLIKGRKRHLFVDTQGLLLKAFVTEANYHDGTLASGLLTILVMLCPRLAHLWADQAYRGRFTDRAQELGLSVDIVTPTAEQRGFQVQPRRWVVERTFAWLGNYRRLSKDYEKWVETADATIYAAMIHLMTRRLARLKRQN